MIKIYFTKATLNTIVCQALLVLFSFQAHADLTACDADVDGDGTVTIQDLISIVNFFGQTCTGCTSAPSAPLGVGATTGSTEGTIQVSWTASQGAESYTVYYDTSSGAPYSFNKATGSSTSTTLTSLTPDATYYVAIIASNACGDSSYSAQVQADAGSSSGNFQDYIEPALGSNIQFLAVNGGNFDMGAPEDESGSNAEEWPVHAVQLSDFYAGAYEVTQAQWVAVMGENPSWGPHQDCPTCPVDSVSYNDITEAGGFLATLNATSTETYRLLTEAEWEYICRANTTTPFNTGACLSATTEANYRGTTTPYPGCTSGPYVNRTTAAGSYPSNDWGFYDLHGNVMEWVQDWYQLDYYGSSPATDPVCTNNTSGNRAERGGHWGSSAESCRSAARASASPANSSYRLGFRIARTR